MSDTMPSDRDITRAQRFGRLAAREGRSLASACPYDANGTPAERVLARRFVQAYVGAGGTVDGLTYGDGEWSEDGNGNEFTTTGDGDVVVRPGRRAQEEE
jgi:hypothetical protein